jgi:thiamine-phosphate pyrophosphorylase
MPELKSFSGLYAIIDSVAHAAYGFERLLEKIVLESTIPIVQFRWKTLNGHQKSGLLKEAARLKAQRDFILIVNDDSEYLDHSAVDGLHLGQKDIALEMVRKIHPEKLYGLSTHSLDQAQAGGKRAHYIGCGAVYATASKTHIEIIGLQGLCEMVTVSSVPTIAIGGITSENISEVAKSGCSMAAVIGALVHDGKFEGQKLHEIFMHHRRV